MAEFPALPIFTDAYLGDTRHLTTAQHGAYFLLLMIAWRTADCSLPNDDTFLARCVGMDKRTWANNKEVILAFWTLTADARLQQKRLLDERIYAEHKRNKNSEAGKSSALKRKNRGSTSVQPNANETSTPTPTPTYITPVLSSVAMDGFEKIIEEGTRFSPRLATANMSAIRQWLQADCDLELDILPEIRRLGPRQPSGWAYFTGAILDAKATRLAPTPEGIPRHGRKNKTDEAFAEIMKQFETTGE